MKNFEGETNNLKQSRYRNIILFLRKIYVFMIVHFHSRK